MAVSPDYPDLSDCSRVYHEVRKYEAEGYAAEDWDGVFFKLWLDQMRKHFPITHDPLRAKVLTRENGSVVIMLVTEWQREEMVCQILVISEPQAIARFMKFYNGIRI